MRDSTHLAACMGMESHLVKIENKWIDNWLWTKRPSGQRKNQDNNVTINRQRTNYVRRSDRMKLQIAVLCFVFIALASAKRHRRGKDKLMGCRFDVSVSECNQETNMVTKTFTVTAGDPKTCQPESIAYSCELHEKLMRWKQKRQDKKKSKNHKRKEWKNKRRQNRRERLSI
ncbi:unnamed protein product [Mytilus coruscus]|uniref:Pleiotrophin/Midkine C-terminal domain-containing protein n=1 Tax=Mytilus coruscus TaxID=42192 RepID=A0A6J8A677_MYTCO|nr:unnamed protein product [Mytilus coruscus]